MHDKIFLGVYSPLSPRKIGSTEKAFGITPSGPQTMLLSIRSAIDCDVALAVHLERSIISGPDDIMSKAVSTGLEFCGHGEYAFENVVSSSSLPGPGTPCSTALAALTALREAIMWTNC